MPHLSLRELHGGRCGLGRECVRTEHLAEQRDDARALAGALCGGGGAQCTLSFTSLLWQIPSEWGRTITMVKGYQALVFHSEWAHTGGP